MTLPPYTLRQGPQSNPELADVGGPTLQLALPIPCLHLIRLDLEEPVMSTKHLCGFWGSETQVPTLAQQVL